MLLGLTLAIFPAAIRQQSGTPAAPVSGAILLEDGIFFLLQEDGSKLLLE
jgi:hypothetical protein